MNAEQGYTDGAPASVASMLGFLTNTASEARDACCLCRADDSSRAKLHKRGILHVFKGAAHPAAAADRRHGSAWGAGAVQAAAQPPSVDAAHSKPAEVLQEAATVRGTHSSVGPGHETAALDRESPDDKQTASSRERERIGRMQGVRARDAHARCRERLFASAKHWLLRSVREVAPQHTKICRLHGP